MEAKKEALTPLNERFLLEADIVKWKESKNGS